jgi:hypothetical protein
MIFKKKSLATFTLQGTIVASENLLYAKFSFGPPTPFPCLICFYVIGKEV